jgi:WbqC-like protein family
LNQQSPRLTLWIPFDRIAENLTKTMQPAKAAAIVQSNYIPWKGYFDLINMVDEFILLDDVQYTRRDWRNRNLIKTATGLHWLTIPVEVKGRYAQKINETMVSDPGWGKKHWATIVHNYSRARCFRQVARLLEPCFLEGGEMQLSRINYRFIRAICDFLRIGTRISWSTEFPHDEGRNERLISLCKGVGAARYVSGPSAADYMDQALWGASGIAVSYIDYGGYPPYAQLHGEFQHGVSVLDLLFNEGEDAPRYMKSFGRGK